MKKFLPLLFLVTFATFGVAQVTCLPDGMVFTSQAQVDQFVIDHPDCKETLGKITLQGSGSINNLDGLKNIEIIGGALHVWSHSNLKNLEGLNNVKHIDGKLDIRGNDALESLDGLDNLETTGGEIEIGNNPVLQNLNGLKKLGPINGYLRIYNNAVLDDISGIENMSHDAIWVLTVEDCPALSACNVTSVCNYILHSLGDSAMFGGNAAGCNTAEEILEKCISSTTNTFDNPYMLLPNPTQNRLTISPNLEGNDKKIRVYDVKGQLMLSQKLIGQEIEVTDLTNGVYFLQIVTETEGYNFRFVKI